MQINPLHTDQIRVEAFQRCLLSEAGESRAYTYSAAQVPRSVTTGQVGLRQSQGAKLGSPVSARSRERGRRVDFIDVTSAFGQTVTTGIQRVTRNVAMAAVAARTTLVAYTGYGQQWIAIHPDWATSAPTRSPTSRLREPARGTLALMSHRLGLSKTSGTVHRTAKWARDKVSTGSRSEFMIRRLDPSELAGARLFLPEIPVSRRHTSALASLVDHQGVEAHAFVHDLLPLSHPEFFLVDPRLEFLDYLALLRSCTTLVAASEDVVNRVAQITTALWDGSSPLPQVRRAALPTSYTPMAKPWLAPDVPTFVALGTLEPRKNLIVLFQAARLLARTRRIRISVFYTRGALSHELREAVDAAKQSGVDVLLQKSRSDHEVQEAVREASALVYASLGEGYGLPVVEALSVGTPVVTSNRRPLSEHSQYGGVLQVDPTSVVDLVEAMDSLCDPDVRRRVAASIEVSRIPHDWSQWAGEFLDPDSQTWTRLN